MKYLKQLRSDLHQLLASRAEDGPYRYLIKDWRSISDINLAADVLGADVFRAQLKPVRLPLEKIESLLVIAPHQDDEAIGVGGTLALAKNSNSRISILFVTDGGQNTSSYARTVAETCFVRKQEAMTVCGRLNADSYDLNISNISPQPNCDDVVRLHEIISQIKPQIVLCPWLLDSPSKHRMANHLLYLAGKYRKLDDFEVWGYQVHNSLIPNGVIDITEVADEKYELIRCYKSQTENLYRYDHMAMGLAAWNSRYLGQKKGEKLRGNIFHTPEKRAFGIDRRFYLKNLNETYMKRRDLVTSFGELQREFG